MIKSKTLTPLLLAGIFVLMLGLSFAAVPLYDLFCRVTGFGGTTQNASDKEIPKIIVNQDYKMRFDTNVHSTSDWKFYPEKNTFDSFFFLCDLDGHIEDPKVQKSLEELGLHCEDFHVLGVFEADKLREKKN